MLFIKLGGAGTTFQMVDKTIAMQINPLLFLGVLCYGFSFMLYAYILQRSNLSYIVPVCAGVVNVVAVTMGLIVLKERIQPAGIVGIALVIAGIILMSLRK